MTATNTRISVSPCSTPNLELDQCLRTFSDLGYDKFEAFTTSMRSALNLSADPANYRDMASRMGMAFSSMHLPPIKADDFDSTLANAVDATHFAAELGAPVVLVKASDRPTYIRAAGPYLDAIADSGVTPVLQNHLGSPISSIEDFRELIKGIDDSRMKTLLEVGHFHAAGVSWREGFDLLGQSIALVHIKDMVAKQSVPFGRGEVDLPALFAQLHEAGYTGDFVIEMEVADQQNTVQYLGEALNFVRPLKGIEP